MSQNATLLTPVSMTIATNAEVNLNNARRGRPRPPSNPIPPRSGPRLTLPGTGLIVSGSTQPIARHTTDIIVSMMSGLEPPTDSAVSTASTPQFTTPTTPTPPASNLPTPPLQQPPGYPGAGRRTHRKSRTGCSRCKARKIKVSMPCFLYLLCPPPLTRTSVTRDTRHVSIAYPTA